METIQWGIIGCGDVTELKSGPAFNKVPNSTLVAVMRRDEKKVIDYAKRHGVPKWYTDANELINDPEVNAIYVATPPMQHEEYTLAALQAGKPVYVEKPMSTGAEAAKRMSAAATDKKLSVAHYRRAQPMFIKLKELILSDLIGEIRFANLIFLEAGLTTDQLKIPKVQWRINPSIAGGGLFHDLAPHQIDLMLYFFGRVESMNGVSANQAKSYGADDFVAGNIKFKNGVIFHGLWSFTVPKEEETDRCEIIGSTGKISFSVFGAPEILITKNGHTSRVTFEKLQHVQQPMIEKVVQFFLDKGENPATPEDGVEVMRIIDAFTAK